jgi:hypothetical protein
MLIGYCLWHFAIKDFGDFTKVPLDQSAFLRDVAEPITPIKAHGESASDQVWMGVTYLDAKHVERYAEWVYTSYAPVELHDTLMLGTSRNIKPVPAGGADERAFLGLLQRWYRQDAEARRLMDHPKRLDFSTLTEQQRARVRAAAIMKRLLNRN